MELRQLLHDDDAVSPVIGVILMVAITVILAAVIATFVLGLGEQVSQTAPQASFTFDYEEGSSTDDWSENDGDGLLTITHAGGATLTASNLDVVGSSVSGTGGAWDSADDYGPSSKISAGDSLDVRIENDDTILVTWTADSGQDSATLTDFTGPGA